MHVGQEQRPGGAAHLAPPMRRRVRRALRSVQRSYDPDGQVGLVGRTGALAVYGLAVSSVMAAARLAGGPPARFEPTDLVLGGIATHKFARLVTKSSVASPIRAPFTEFVECAGPSEHSEVPRDGNHAQHAIGELLTCPFCLGVWVASGYVVALAVAPRGARAWAAVFTVSAIADTMQHLYTALKR